MSCAVCGVDTRLFGHSKLCLEHFLQEGAEREREKKRLRRKVTPAKPTKEEDATARKLDADRWEYLHRKKLMELNTRAAPFNWAAYNADQAEQLKELRAVNELARKVIDIGYRVLAKEAHPDKGGSTETMRRLNAVRRRLRASVPLPKP
jgi:hypothetical protein